MDYPKVGEKLKDKWLIESQKDDQFDGQEFEQWPISCNIMSDDNVEFDESISRKRNTEDLDDWKPRVSEGQTQTFRAKQILSLEDNRSDTDRRIYKGELQNAPLDGLDKELQSQSSRRYGKLPSLMDWL